MHEGHATQRRPGARPAERMQKQACPTAYVARRMGLYVVALLPVVIMAARLAV